MTTRTSCVLYYDTSDAAALAASPEITVPSSACHFLCRCGVSYPPGDDGLSTTTPTPDAIEATVDDPFIPDVDIHVAAAASECDLTASEMWADMAQIESRVGKGKVKKNLGIIIKKRPRIVRTVEKIMRRARGTNNVKTKLTRFIASTIFFVTLLVIFLELLPLTTFFFVWS